MFWLLLRLLFLPLWLLLFTDPYLWAATPKEVHHDLSITLYPEQSTLSGTDTLRIDRNNETTLAFDLAAKAQVTEVRVNGATHGFVFREGHLHIPLDPEERSAALSVTISYSASFDHVVPEAPPNTDNPGYGVTGIISGKGSFLQAGAGWYPEIEGGQSTYDLSVTAPAGTLAVSAGEPLGHRTEGTKTVSLWKIRHPVGGLSLSAGRYSMKTREVGKVKAMTYFFREEDDSLSRSYLDATARYMALYEDLIGPYPFEKFAVVENFLPTGFGFPSYTLLGSTVLRLPFIIDTSLGHEIAHSWWGNGVLVDFDHGNWCEGLTTYVSDYLYKEQVSAREARDYRLQILRTFTTLVNPGKDFPLRSFQGRYDPASQAIGYGKGAFVFHMVRRRVGEKAFWNALREVYRKRLFLKTSWEDFQRAFERQGQCSLQVFFDQWLSRKGAPRLSLDRAESGNKGDFYHVQARLNQSQPSYELELPVVLSTKNRTMMEKIILSGESSLIQFASSDKPEKLAVDPEFHVFRYLDAEEIPLSVNTVKGAPSVTMAISSDAQQEMESLAETLVLALGLKKYRITPDKQIKHPAREQGDLVLIGFQEGIKAVNLPPGVVIKRESFTIGGKTFTHPADAFFGVFPRPHRGDGFVALFLPLSMNHAQDVARKITHYGGYSYLVFKEGQNQIKGIWPVTESPLIYQWPNDSSPRGR
jgi:aminopeptidase N